MNLKLLDTCEPLFQYVCRLNRSARKGGQHTLPEVQAELKHILHDIRVKAKQDVEIMNHMQQGHIYLVLVFFVDFMVSNSSLPFAGDWPNIAAEYHEMAGDAKFFELLNATLADRSELANERLAVFYTCMGLGFTGMYFGQPERLRRKMLECAARLRGVVSADETTLICPESYNPDKSILFKPVRSSLVGISITLVVLLAALFVLNVLLFSSESKTLSDDLSKVQNSSMAEFSPRQGAPAQSGRNSQSTR